MDGAPGASTGVQVAKPLNRTTCTTSVILERQEPYAKPAPQPYTSPIQTMKPKQAPEHVKLRLTWSLLGSFPKSGAQTI